MDIDQCGTNPFIVMTQTRLFQYDVPHIMLQLFAVFNSELRHIFLIAHIGSIHTTSTDSEIFYGYILM
jgi:hypothetical protein